VPDKREIAIRTLEVEAEMNERQAGKFDELASNISDPEHKLKLEVLSKQAAEKAAEMRHQVQLSRDQS
jgi:CHASE3 domain sensor protein